jgi:hypothetical protein
LPGLFMQMGGGAGRTSDAADTAQSAPQTISEAAFGSQYSGSSSGKSSGLLGALAPNDAFGIAHIAGLGATAFLVWVYWTLPN